MNWQADVVEEEEGLEMPLPSDMRGRAVGWKISVCARICVCVRVCMCVCVQLCSLVLSEF